jgi:hypothetical protein
VRLLAIDPPAPADGPLVKKFPSIGVDWQRGSFTVGKLSYDTWVRAVAEGRSRIQSAQPAATTANGWTFAPAGGSWGVDYLSRAAAARAGAVGALAQDEIVATTRVDATGRPLDGAHRYVLRFAKGDRPPARAFWSLTLVGADGRLADNRINRYAVRGDRVERGRDGGVAIPIQLAPPSGAPESNWLPAPSRPFQLVLRLYAPAPEAVAGRWAPPAVTRVD